MDDKPAQVTGHSAQCTKCGKTIRLFFTHTPNVDATHVGWRDTRLFAGKCTGCGKVHEYEVLPPTKEYRVRLLPC